MSGGFDLNPAAELAAARIGGEGEAMIRVDNAMRDPGALVDAAAEQLFKPAAEFNSGYPGLLAPAPLAYVDGLVRALDPLIRQTFRLPEVKLGRAICNFSLVTLPPEQLSTPQRLPHIDTVDPYRFAFLHYLCDERFGGTGFYRHRATGFETLNAQRLDHYRAVLAEEVAAAPPDAAYVRGDTPLFEQTARTAARFDRLVVYRSCNLHSGQIDFPELLAPDPRAGRLTANIFLSYTPL